MGLVWNDSLATGNSQIDTQHQELFNRLNGLIDSMKQGKGKDVLADVFKFVDHYLTLHFGTEERMMKAYNYPGYNEHIKQHELFTVKFKELKERLDKEGVTSTIVIEAQPLLVDWWYNHINKVDKILGAFLKEK
jgi:hemerythrin